jgi:MFS family permease
MCRSTMMRRPTKSLVFAAMGHLYEHYNSSVFNFSISLLGPLFFPNDTWTHYAVAAGFIMQPFGAIIFSWIGDRMGRRPAVIYAFALSIIPTIVIGLLPTYLKWGVFSSLLLIWCRILQGASIGGAFYGAITFVSETSKPSARNLNMAFILPMGFVGVILGIIFFRVMLSISLEFAWRLPFLVGGLVGVILYLLRNSMVESAVWEASVFEKKIPLRNFIKDYKSNLLAVLFAGMGGFVPFYLAAGWLPTILKNQYSLSNATVFNISIAIMALGAICTSLSCWINTFFNLRKSLSIYIAAWIPLGILLYVGLREHNLTFIVIAQLLIAANTGLCLAAFLFIQKLFPLQYSYSGFAIPYSVGQTILTGTTPLFAGFIEKSTGNAESTCVLIILSTILMAGMLLLGKPVTEKDA